MEMKVTEVLWIGTKEKEWLEEEILKGSREKMDRRRRGRRKRRRRRGGRERGGEGGGGGGKVTGRCVLN